MSKSEDNISVLISALKQGEEKAFRAIYEIYVDALKAFINSYTKNREQTNDIVQDTFLKLWNIRFQLDKNKSLKSLLFKISHNIFIDKYRKKQRETDVLDGWMRKRLIELVKGDDDEKKHRIKTVESAIEKLPPRCKEIFLLSKFEQLKYQEIANQLNISVKTVEAQMGKAFRLIKEELEIR